MGDIYTAADIVYGLLFTAAVGMVALSHHEMRAARICLGLGGLLMATRWLSWAFTVESPWQARAVIGGLIGAVLLAGMPALWQWSIDKEKTAQPELAVLAATNSADKKPLTMWQLFATDFPEIGRTMMKTIAILQTPDGPKQQEIHVALYWDFPTNSYFLAIYFEPTNTDSDVLSLAGASNFVPQMIGMMSQLHVTIETPGETREISLSKMNFSKQIFLYIDESFSVQKLSEIENAYTTHGYDVSIRTSTYRSVHFREYDRPKELLNFKPIEKMGEANIRMPKGSVDGEIISFKNVPSAEVLSHAKAQQSSPPPTPTPPPQPEKK